MAQESKVLKYTLAAGDFDNSLLPPEARDPASPAFRDAVKSYLESEFGRFGGWCDVQVDEQTIRVRWTPDRRAPDPLDQVIAKLQRGETTGAITLLDLFLADQPGSLPILYNLGMALSDVGRLEEAERHLRRALEIEPKFTNARVALGVALQRRGNAAEAISTLEDAVDKDPTNPWAHRNLAACFANTGRMREAIEQFRCATQLNPQDQANWLGLAQGLASMRESEEADKAYRQVLAISDHGQHADMARDGLAKLAHETFRQRGGSAERPDAVMYCLGALERFQKLLPVDVQRIAFEIALLGQRGLDVNDPAQKYHLKSLPGSFSGLHLVCLMYVGFKQIAPEQDIGFDLSREYAAAKSLYRPSD